MSPSESDAGVRAARYALAVLTFINLFNYLDRWLLASVLESIKGELHFSDTQLGALTTGFIIVYAVTSPIFGSLGDRKKRPPLIGLGVAIWSLATTLAGFARGFVSMFAARSTVGIGEAAYGTIAPALLADHFPKEKRGRVFAIFFAAIPVGSAAGYVVGGLIDQYFGWRAAFWIAGAPGLLLSLLVLAIREVPRGLHDEGVAVVAQGSRSTWHDYADLLHNRRYLVAVVGYGAYTFALGGLGTWMPVFLERVRGMSRHDATVSFGVVVLFTGFIGTYIGGVIGDYALRWSRDAYLWFCGIVTLIGAPVTFVALTHPDKSVYFPALVVAELLVFASTGPINSAIVNAVAPGERATAVALSILVMHLLGDVPSPSLIGFISDHSSLGRAFLTVPVAILAAGAIWTYGAWRERGRVGGEPLA